jgi:imidazolonepropionase-like amidohydrolase
VGEARGSQAGATPMDFVMVGATVVDGTGGEPVTSAALHVQDGRIAWVGPLAAFQKRGSESRIVEASGQTIIPGLIDAHIHLCWNGLDSIPELMRSPRDQLLLEAAASARRVLASGTTTVRDIGGQDYLEMSLRWAIDGGYITGPRMRTSGRFITMTGGHAHFVGREADGPEEIRKAVREQVKAGADNIKLMATGGVATAGQDVRATQLTVEEMAAAVEAAHTSGRTVAAHCHGGAGIRNAVLAGVDSIEHGSYMDEETADMMRARGTAVVLTLGLSNPLVQPTASTAQAEADRIRQHLPAMRRALETTVVLTRARGVLVGLGSDAGGNPLRPHDQSMAQELEELVALGYPPLDALTAATRNNAQILRVSDQVGTLEPGKLADFVLLGANPLLDIAAVRQVRAVFKAGINVLLEHGG